jgi:hypothetical protein
MSDLTPEQYEAAIPRWCTYQTVQEHIEKLMLCWALVRYAERGEAKPERTCISCDLYVGAAR